MNNFFQENKNGIVIPTFKNIIQKKDISLFINFINNSKISDNIQLLLNLMKENFEIFANSFKHLSFL